MDVKGRVMAMDWGAVRIGVALCDPTRTVVRGWGTIDQNKSDPFPILKNIVAEEKVVELVLGLPERADGSPGTHDKPIREFGDQLIQLLSLPLHFQEESFTSQRASAMMVQSGFKKKKRREKGHTDRIAACFILQDWLDTQG